jgi:C4-dicarboxylate-binding protein DctP
MKKGQRRCIMKKGVIVGFVVLIIGTFFFFVDICPAQEKYLMRFNHGLPEDHFAAKQYEEWGTSINQRSKGALKVEIFPSAQLFKDQELVRAVQMGTIESGACYTFNLARSMPEFNVLGVPFTFYTTDQLVRIFNSDVRTILDKIAERQDIKTLMYIPWPVEGLGFISKKPLRNPSDCKGKVFRAVDNVTASLIQFWGGGASFVSGAELYMALQRGTIDASFAGVQTLVERKLYEVAPCFIKLPVSNASAIIIINKGFFSKLPKELQEVVLDVSKEIEKKSPQAAMEADTRDANFLKEKGLPLPYAPTQAEMALWQKGTKPIRESVMTTSEGKELLKKVDSILAP